MCLKLAYDVVPHKGAECICCFYNFKSLLVSLHWNTGKQSNTLCKQPGTYIGCKQVHLESERVKVHLISTSRKEHLS